MCVLFFVHFILYVIEIQSEFMILQKKYILHRFINHLKITSICGLNNSIFSGQMGNGRLDLRFEFRATGYTGIKRFAHEITNMPKIPN